MTSKKTAAILTIVGGVFYILGGALVAVLLEAFSSSFSGAGGLGLFNTTGSIGFLPSSDYNFLGTGSGLSSGSVGAIGNVLLAIGLVTGLLIILGGVLINSETPGRRKAGGILVIVMILIGGLTTLGGLVIGFILAGIGAYLGLTYKSNSRGMVFGLGPIGSVTLGSTATPMPSGPAGTGPLNYCIKCGSPIREGAVFCGACGARLLD